MKRDEAMETMIPLLVSRVPSLALLVSKVTVRLIRKLVFQGGVVFYQSDLKCESE